MMTALLASFIFTTNSLATVLGPFAAIPPVGVCSDTHERVDLTRANWQQRERCGWYDCDVSARPETHSNEVAVVTGYVPATAPKHGYVAQYEVREVPPHEDYKPWAKDIIELRDIYHDDLLGVTFKKKVGGGRVYMKVIAVDGENAQ